MKFVPDGFKPLDKDIVWAMTKFRISRQEADRQLEAFRDHEFRRNYTDWNRCFRNWFRSADKYGLLDRSDIRRTFTTELSNEEWMEQRMKDQKDFERDNQERQRLRIVK